MTNIAFIGLGIMGSPMAVHLANAGHNVAGVNLDPERAKTLIEAGGRAAESIADAPGRNEPGTGTLPLEPQLTALEAHGYTGWVGLEYKPSTTTPDSLTWLPRQRRSLPS